MDIYNQENYETINVDNFISEIISFLEESSIDIQKQTEKLGNGSKYKKNKHFYNTVISEYKVGMGMFRELLDYIKKKKKEKNIRITDLEKINTLQEQLKDWLDIIKIQIKSENFGNKRIREIEIETRNTLKNIFDSDEIKFHIEDIEKQSELLLYQSIRNVLKQINIENIGLNNEDLTTLTKEIKESTRSIFLEEIGYFDKEIQTNITKIEYYKKVILTIIEDYLKKYIGEYIYHQTDKNNRKVVYFDSEKITYISADLENYYRLYINAITGTANNIIIDLEIIENLEEKSY